MPSRITKSPEEVAKKVIKGVGKTTKTKTKQVTNAERERYKKRKHLVKTLEETNHSKIIAFATVGETGFWKLIGNSAIYYTYHEAIRLKKDVSLRRDTDFFEKDPNGFVAIHNIDQLEKDLEKLGGKATAEIDDEYIKVFDMGVKFSDADLKNMLRREEMMNEQINRMLLPKVSDPELYKTLREMIELICVCQKLTAEPLRRLTYDAVLNPTRLAMMHYIYMCRNSSTVEEARKKIVTDLEMVVAGIKTIQNLVNWKLKHIHEISSFASKGVMLANKLGVKGNGNGVH